MEKEKHLSDSEVQRKIEIEVLESLGRLQQFKTKIYTFTFHLSGYRFDVDGV